MVKDELHTAAFVHLKTLQQTYIKIKYFTYEHLKKQPYKTEQDMDSDGKSICFAPRTKCVRMIKNKFN